MPTYDKQAEILQKIVRYCEEIDLFTERFGRTRKAFQEDLVFQRACAMCIMQIGELSSRLPEEFRAAYDKVPWQRIRSMRNVFVHDYENIDLLRTWETIETRVPELKAYCESILRDLASDNDDAWGKK